MRLLRWVLVGLLAGLLAGFLGGLLGARRPAKGAARYIPPSPDDDEDAGHRGHGPRAASRD